MELKIYSAIRADKKWVRDRIIRYCFMMISCCLCCIYGASRLSVRLGDKGSLAVMIICMALGLFALTRSMAFVVSALASAMLICVDGRIRMQILREKFFMQFDKPPTPEQVQRDNGFWTITDSEGSKCEIPLEAFPNLDKMLPNEIQKALNNPGSFVVHNI